MPDYFCNSFETPLLPGSFLKFWDLGALGNCLTQLPKGRAGPAPTIELYIKKKTSNFVDKAYDPFG